MTDHDTLAPRKPPSSIRFVRSKNSPLLMAVDRNMLQQKASVEGLPAMLNYSQMFVEPSLDVGCMPRPSGCMTVLRRFELSKDTGDMVVYKETTRFGREWSMRRPAPKPKPVAWARGREFSRRCPHCGARITRHKDKPIPLPWPEAPAYTRTFACGTEQCIRWDKKGKLIRWTDQCTQCVVNEIAFWRERYTALRKQQKGVAP